MIPITYYILLSGILFGIGLLIVIIKNNAILVLIGIELMLNAANINLVAFSANDTQIQGQIFALFVILLAAAETAVGLAIIVNVYRYFKTNNIENIS